MWNNVWLLETGSGTESGKGWSSLTVDSNGTFTSLLPLPAPVTNLGSKPAKTVTGTMTGTSSDEMNYGYETTFTRTALGWSVEDSGSGSHKVKSHTETTIQGSDQNSGHLSQVHVSSWEPQKGEFQFDASASLDSSITHDDQSLSSFNWSNGRSTSTEKSRSTLTVREKSDQTYTAQLWKDVGNLGSGNGSSESYDYSWKQSSNSSNTESLEVTRTSVANGKRDKSN